MNVLFLCTGNACRSQMAEGWARHLAAPGIRPYSAGIMARGLDARAVQVMAEVGVAIAHQHSKTVDDLGDVTFDVVITLCGDARETCPAFACAPRLMHRGFDDPPRLAERSASAEEALGHYRRVRDEIGRFVEDLPRLLRLAATTRAKDDAL